jgi:hypothetical protein
VATGCQALYSDDSNWNTATGYQALFSGTSAYDNTAVGFQALISNNGNNNVAVGQQAGSNLTTGSNNIDIGDATVNSVADDIAGESDTIRIGSQQTQKSTYIAGIYNRPVGCEALAVIIDSTGKLGTIKLCGTMVGSIDKITDMRVAMDQVKASNARLEAKNLQLETDATNLKATVAGQAKTIAQEQSDFHATLAQQQAEIQNLTAGLKEEESLLQKVSYQVQLTKPAPQVAANY